MHGTGKKLQLQKSHLHGQLNSCRATYEHDNGNGIENNQMGLYGSAREDWMTGIKGKGSSLDIAPLTILDSGALQPRKWQLTDTGCSTPAQASGCP